MSKIYAFLIILPIIALLLIKALAFYEFDTKQRYIKNAIDVSAHKVMITGVLTDADMAELLTELNQLANFGEEDVILESGSINADGSSYRMVPYTVGEIVDRGEIFSILVKSENESMISRIEGAPYGENSRLLYKAKSTCRVERKQPDE